MCPMECECGMSGSLARRMFNRTQRAVEQFSKVHRRQDRLCAAITFQFSSKKARKRKKRKEKERKKRREKKKTTKNKARQYRCKKKERN